MAGGFAKLDSGIVDSTLWMQPHDVLRVWIALLAKCDSYGIVRSSVPSLAHLCMVSIDRLEQIMQVMTSPDPYSRTSDDDGRRLKTIEGGWLIINYVKYRELVQTKPQSHAERQRKYRERITERDRRVTGDAKVTQTVTSDAEAEAEEEAKAEAKKPQKKKKTRAVRAELFPLPEGFSVSERVAKWASAKGHTRLDEHLEAFAETAKARAYMYADWDCAFMKAIRENWAKVGIGNRNGHNTQSRNPTLPERMAANNAAAEAAERSRDDFFDGEFTASVR